MNRLRWLPVAFLALAACTHSTPTIPDPVSRPSDPSPIGPGCDAQPDPHCSNLVNRVMVPMYRGAGIDIVDESNSELCRRMALDLVGRIPTVDEQAQCANQTADQMADMFMGSPEYEREQRRMWGERFYNLDEQWYPYAVSIDEMVEQLYREYIPYQEFITRLLVHPGLYGVFRGDDWSSAVIRYAFNRNARADEIFALRPLARAWQVRHFCDGVVWWNYRTSRGGSDDSADGQCGRDEVAVNFCRCRDDDGSSLCHTDAFGATVDFGTDGCVNPDNHDDDANLLRVIDEGAGRGPVCPGMPYYNQCQDRAYGDSGVAGQLRRLNGVSPGQLDHLYGLGRALAQRQDFWEAEVDRELKHFLAWWQNGLRRPDFDIPEVRSVLANELRRTGSVRQLQRYIVTSLLYTARAELAPGEPDPSPALPVWATGPTRIMTSERWLDSAFYVAFGQTAGICDFRFVTENYDWRMLINDGLAMPPPMTNSFTDSYRDWAQALGGCSSSRSRPVASSLSIVTAQHQIAQTLCAAGSDLLAPNTSDDISPDNYAAAATRIYQRAIGRTPTPDEVSAAVDDMMACNAEGGDNGCGGSGQAAMRWFCARLVDSAEFAVY